jgi:hypothetical protein
VKIPASHPYWHVRALVEHSEIAQLRLSYYAYRPQTVEDSRQVLNISARSFLDEPTMEALMDRTPPDHELAIHSDVVLADSQRCHLVMIDMSTGAKAHLEKLRAFLIEHVHSDLVWFSSGRSFHGYGNELLAQQEWVRFMGLLLLANKPKLELTVDPRWIGHRLLAGYSALRWTKNTAHYLVAPTRAEPIRTVRGANQEVGALGSFLRR